MAHRRRARQRGSSSRSSRGGGGWSRWCGVPAVRGLTDRGALALRWSTITPCRLPRVPPSRQPAANRSLSMSSIFPDPRPDQAILKLLASGICHSQVHELHDGRARPTAFGHEATGVVVKAGSAVTRVREGDRAIVTWVRRQPLPMGGDDRACGATYRGSPHSVAALYLERAHPDLGTVPGADRRQRAGRPVLDHRLRGADRRRRGDPHHAGAAGRIGGRVRGRRRGAVGGACGRDQGRRSDHRGGPARRQAATGPRVRRHGTP